MWVEYNPNPSGKSVGDCVIRAVAKVLDLSWEEAYAELCLQGYMMHDMPSANEVWGAYLKSKGFLGLQIAFLGRTFYSAGAGTLTIL